MNDVYEKRQREKKIAEISRQVAAKRIRRLRGVNIPNHGSVHPTTTGVFVDLVIFIPQMEIDEVINKERDRERARKNKAGDAGPEGSRGPDVVETVGQVHEGDS
jgi:hypothetical protein